MKRKVKMVAVVHCVGGCAVTDGIRACSFGCIGCGACVSACRKDAIHIEENGTARVDRRRCVGCGLCARACPQSVIRMEPAWGTIQPLCSNHDAGAAAKAACANSCIACRICEKNCPADAISVTENAAVIDPLRCIACGMCAVKCPRGVIRDADGVMTEAF